MRVGHLVGSFLHVTEHWIHAQMTAAARLEPLVLNRGDRLNDHLFGSAPACHLADLRPGECATEADGWERDRYSPAFARACRAARIDVLHAHFGPEGALGLRLAAALGRPLVTSFYGYDAGTLPRSAAWRRTLRQLFADGTLFLAEGPALAARLVELGCPPDRVRVQPLPLRIPTRATRRREPLVVVCGRFVEKKGTDTSLRVLRRALDQSRVPFSAVVVGDGPLRPALERLHADLRLGSGVTFTGNLDPPDLERLLQRASVVLQMSRTARDGDREGGAPVIVSQSLAWGVPVVASRHCDIPWVVEDGRSGFIVAEGGVDEAARRVTQLLERPAVHGAMSQSARQAARRRFSRAVVGRLLDTHYAEAVQIGPVPRRRAATAQIQGMCTAVAVGLRHRAGDASGLARLGGAPDVVTEVRILALRQAADLERGAGRHGHAARLLGRWRALAPRDPYAGLEEARAWMASATPARAVAPLAHFVAAHPNRRFALDTAVETLASREDAHRLMSRLLASIGTPDERLEHDVRVIGARARSRARGARRTLRSALERFRRAQRAVRRPHTPPEAGLAATFVLAATLGDAQTIRGLRWLLAAGRVRSPLLRYRMASAIERRGGTLTSWARQAFSDIARNARLPDELRSGARVHLQRIDLMEHTSS